jgi:hypothetical protein
VGGRRTKTQEERPSRRRQRPLLRCSWPLAATSARRPRVVLAPGRRLRHPQAAPPPLQQPPPAWLLHLLAVPVASSRWRDNDGGEAAVGEKAPPGSTTPTCWVCAPTSGGAHGEDGLASSSVPVAGDGDLGLVDELLAAPPARRAASPRRAPAARSSPRRSAQGSPGSLPPLRPRSLSPAHPLARALAAGVVMAAAGDCVGGVSQ